MFCTERINKNVQQIKDLAQYYRAEFDSKLAKNARKLYGVKDVWKCRILAFLWLYGLFWSIPVSTFLCLGLLFYFWINNKRKDDFIPYDQRKTVLITGASSTKGKLPFKYLLSRFLVKMLFLILYKKMKMFSF